MKVKSINYQQVVVWNKNYHNILCFSLDRLGSWILILLPGERIV